MALEASVNHLATMRREPAENGACSKADPKHGRTGDAVGVLDQDTPEEGTTPELFSYMSQ